MKQRISLGCESQILKVGVSTTGPQNIHIRVSDADQVNTILTDRYNIVDGIQYFFIRMPKAPGVALVEVYNEKTGSTENNDGFSMVEGGLWRMPLERKTAGIDITDPDVRTFIDYGQRFCYHAGHLKTGDYVSDNDRIHFNYLPAITDERGAELNTPAQTGEITGEIEISQKKFRGMTVPMRFAIVCHEFAHYYLNKNMYNEMEADMQGLNIYLGLGYPRYEAYEAFLETFKGAANNMNIERLKKIEWYIGNFEKLNTVTLYSNKKTA